MTENNKTTIIRTILSAVAVIIVLLGSLEVIPKTISLVAGSAILAGSSIWNGVESIMNQRMKSGIINIVAAVLLITICIAAVVL